jgi:hypothetical protein
MQLKLINHNPSTGKHIVEVKWQLDTLSHQREKLLRRSSTRSSSPTSSPGMKNSSDKFVR